MSLMILASQRATLLLFFLLCGSMAVAQQERSRPGASSDLQLGESIGELKGDLRGLRESVSSLAASVKSLESEVRDIRKELQDVRKEVDRLSLIVNWSLALLAICTAAVVSEIIKRLMAKFGSPGPPPVAAPPVSAAGASGP